MHKCNIISAVLTKTYIIHTSTANTHFYCHFDRCIEETPWVNLLAVHRVKESSPCMHGWPQLAARGLQREPPAFVLPSPPACLETPGRSFFCHWLVIASRSNDIVYFGKQLHYRHSPIHVSNNTS